MSREIRSIARPCELRADEGKARTIFGYAAVYYDAAKAGTEYMLWSDIKERIMPGAFDRAIREDDVRALWNHDPNVLLARTKSKTLTLGVDSTGLLYEFAENTKDIDSVRVAEKIARGDADGSSFAFEVLSADWTEEKQADGKTIWIRSLKELRLFDVSPVTFPAYTAATVGLRCAAGTADEALVRSSLQAWLRQGYSERDAVEVAWRDVELRRQRSVC